MLTLTDRDVEALRRHFSRKGPLRDQWEYKLHGGKIIIYTPVIPWNHQTKKPDPALRYMAKHLRIVPMHPGPFQVGYFRHTEQWWPLDGVGDLEEIIRRIESHSICWPLDQEELERQRDGPPVRFDAE